MVAPPDDELPDGVLLLLEVIVLREEELESTPWSRPAAPLRRRLEDVNIALIGQRRGADLDVERQAITLLEHEGLKMRLEPGVEQRCLALL